MADQIKKRAVRPMKDKSSTFVVRILKNQNYSWQGTVTWVEKSETQSFRSALELLKLMDDVVESGASPGKDTPAE